MATEKTTPPAAPKGATRSNPTRRKPSHCTYCGDSLILAPGRGNTCQNCLHAFERQNRE